VLCSFYIAVKLFIFNKVQCFASRRSASLKELNKDAANKQDRALLSFLLTYMLSMRALITQSLRRQKKKESEAPSLF
jgi:hypothetical protein